MDFLSRLINNTPLSSSSSRNEYAKDPTRRLHRFEKEYSNLLQAWRSSGGLACDADAVERLEILLQSLTSILSDETRRPLPHPCIQFAALKQMYVSVGKIATSSQNEWIVKEAVLFFATLVESEEEAFVENTAFSQSLTNLLVRITGVNSVRLGHFTETRVVELAFNITTKIRLNSAVLPVWFTIPTAPDDDDDENTPETATTERFAGKIQKQDFPLFYILMDYIHHEGKIGDFSRTGLLYIIEAASTSVHLEQWIVESDLATLMATGLGALYSQLSRKLVIDHKPDNLPPVLALSDYQHPRSNYEIISSCSPDFQSHLDTFLSHLLFWQDVLNHCKSVDVKQTLLEHFQVIFLQQLLYPSLLESSDIDGGSSVAVITYLRRILESLDHPDMIHLILHYLLALPTTPSPDPQSLETSVSDARKRKSLDLLSMMAGKADENVTPLLFNLVDLIQACLKSHNQQTIHVTLELLSAILKRHHRYAVTTLLRTVPVTPDITNSRTMGAHQQEVDLLLSLANSMGGHYDIDELYEDVLKDSMTRLESHPCSLKLVTPKTTTTTTTKSAAAVAADALPGMPQHLVSHTIRPSDPLLGTLLDILETFFLNPIETNLSLTETIIDLAICGYMSLEGWLSRNPQTYDYDDDDDDDDHDHEDEEEEEEEEEEEMNEQRGLQEDTDEEGKCTRSVDPESPTNAEFQKLRLIEKCRRQPKWIKEQLPRFLVVLQQLGTDFESYRDTIPRFDDLLQQRREAFQMADAAAAATAAAASNMTPVVPRKPTPMQAETTTQTPDQATPSISRSASPARPPTTFEGLAQRLFADFGTPSSRSASPRGRKEVSQTTSESRVSSPDDKPPPVPPKEFPMNYETPSRSGGVNTVRETPTRQNSSSSFLGRRGTPGAIASQAAAFAMIDQGILARQVGIPGGRQGKAVLEPAVEAADPTHNGQPQPETTLSATEPNETSVASKKDSANPEPAGPDSAQDNKAAQQQQQQQSDVDGADGPATLSPPPPPPPAKTPPPKTVSVSHVLTNAILLQSFVFELAGLMQVRASLFGEVRFV